MCDVEGAGRDGMPLTFRAGKILIAYEFDAEARSKDHGGGGTPAFRNPQQLAGAGG